MPSAPLETESGRVAFTPEQQAADLGLLVAAARKAGVARLIWLRFADGEDGPYTHMGLSDAQLRKKPAAATFARLVGGR